MGREELAKFINPLRDVEDIDDEWYARKIRGSPREINEATAYLIKKVPWGCVEHFGRGGITGGLIGAIVSGDINGTLNGAIIGGTIDWIQYGARAMIKISKTYL